MKKLPKNLSPELEELRSGLIGALPLLGNELASMFGRPLPRLSARDKAGLEKKIDRLLRSTSPPLKKLEELKDDSAEDLERYAALDQFMASMLRACGRRLRPGEDSWEALLRMAARAAEPPRAKWAQLPAYKRSGAHSAVFSGVYTRTLFRHRFSQGSMNGLVLPMRDDMSIQCGCFKPHADDFERNHPRG